MSSSGGFLPGGSVVLGLLRRWHLLLVIESMNLPIFPGRCLIDVCVHSRNDGIPLLDLPSSLVGCRQGIEFPFSPATRKGRPAMTIWKGPLKPRQVPLHLFRDLVFVLISHFTFPTFVVHLPRHLRGGHQSLVGIHCPPGMIARGGGKDTAAAGLSSCAISSFQVLAETKDTAFSTAQNSVNERVSGVTRRKCLKMMFCLVSAWRKTKDSRIQTPTASDWDKGMEAH